MSFDLDLHDRVVVVPRGKLPSDEQRESVLRAAGPQWLDVPVIEADAMPPERVYLVDLVAVRGESAWRRLRRIRYARAGLIDPLDRDWTESVPEAFRFDFPESLVSGFAW